MSLAGCLQDGWLHHTSIKKTTRAGPGRRGSGEQHRVVRRIVPFDPIVLPDSTASMGRVRGKPEDDLRERTHADGP